MATRGRLRTEYLLEGRRLQVADLVENGFLSIGEELVFVRPRLGDRHHARVTADGRIELAGGATYSSPSKAASVAAGGGSFDGWESWRLLAGNLTLDSVRQRFLSDVAGLGAADASDKSRVEAIAHFEFLRQARENAANGTPTRLTVRDFLGHWKSDNRNQSVVHLIDAALDNQSLITEPDFRRIGLDELVALLPRPTDRTHALDSVSSDDSEPIALSAAVTDSDDFEIGITLGNLQSASGGIVSIKPTASFNEAITVMLLNDFSQLPVMTSPRAVKGAITWQSIARERHANPNAQLVDAIVPAQTHRYDAELIDVLPSLQEHDFVLVADATGLISGIVTTVDVAAEYGQLASPFFVLGELDQLLRRLISDTFVLADISDLCRDPNKPLSSFDELTIGDYERVLENPDKWKSLSWSLDRMTFTKRLKELRRIRNDIMHFNPDPIPSNAVDQIRSMIKTIKKYR